MMVHTAAVGDSPLATVSKPSQKKAPLQSPLGGGAAGGGGSAGCCGCWGCSGCCGCWGCSGGLPSLGGSEVEPAAPALGSKLEPAAPAFGSAGGAVLAEPA